MVVEWRQKKTGKSQKTPANESKSSQDDWEVELNDTELTIGFEKAGFGVELSISGEKTELTLGIGVASVTLDLNEPNNSSVSYAFGIYEISGERDGCTVTLTYTIGGIEAKTETRTIPECDEEEETEEEPRDPPEEGEPDEEAMAQPPYPSGDPMDLLIRFNRLFGDNDRNDIADCLYGNLTVLEWSVGKSPTNEGRYRVPIKARCVLHFNGEASYGQYQDYEKSVYFVQESFLGGSYDYRTRLPIRQKWPPYRLGFLTGEFADDGSPIYRYEYINAPAMPFSTAGYFGRRWEFDRVAAICIKADRYAADYYSIFFKEIILEKGGTSDNPPLPPPRPKKSNMDEKCCKMIAQIWEVLRAEDVLKDGYPIPKKLIAPGGKGYDKPKDYPAILKRLIQILDKGLISDFTAILEDADLSTPGNQPQTKSFPDATASMQEVVQFLMKNKVDDAVVQDILIRQTILQAEIMEALMETQSIVKTLLIGLGIPYKNAVGSFNMPVDVDVDEDKSAEKNLPQFLQESQKNYEAVDPDLSSDTLWFYITMMYLKGKR